MSGIALAVAHKVLIWYQGDDEPEVWDVPVGNVLRVTPAEGRVVERIEMWDTPEYRDDLAAKAAGERHHEDTWIHGKPGQSKPAC